MHGIIERDEEGIAIDQNQWSQLWAKIPDLLKSMKLRTIVMTSIKYQPNKRSVVTESGLSYPNTWRPSKVIPSTDVSFERHRQHLILMLGSVDKAEWYLDFLAFQYQRPLEELHHAVYLYHAAGGYGKGVEKDTLSAVFGASAITSVKESKAFQDKSGQVDAFSRTLCFVAEYNGKIGSKEETYIKAMTGMNESHDSRKNEHMKLHQTPANLIMTSNHAPNFIDSEDRRWFISEWHTESFEDAEAKAIYFNEYINWLQNEDGYEAIAGELATRDVTGYNKALPPMRTEEWLKAGVMYTDEGVSVVKDYLDDNPERQVFGKDELHGLFKETSVKSTAVKHKLEEAGLTAEKDRVGGYGCGHTGDKLRVYVRDGFKIDRQYGGNTVVATTAAKSVLKYGESLRLHIEQIPHTPEY